MKNHFPTFSLIRFLPCAALVGGMAGAVLACPARAQSAPTPAAGPTTSLTPAQAAALWRLQLAPGPVRLGPDGKPLQPEPQATQKLVQHADAQLDPQLSTVTLVVLYQTLTAISTQGAHFQPRTPLQHMLAGLPADTRKTLLEAVSRTLTPHQPG
ncbi:hypothetical protein [Oecophyllibacter saccharovorans]|uniref:Tat pathway signal protein n=1 Tax=Oecophyllibacter saccharovorans TaxID=2558360 RepID=A0A506UKI3_9PROT|nr:hypothetical protein [Oecophyllibacter saccharovorans]TPW33836.1 hypothetical protein E3202_04360 [Oecophyllibacter saccharovorans]